MINTKNNFKKEILIWLFFLFKTKNLFVNWCYLYRNNSKILIRVKLEPETAFIGKKFVYIFLGIIFSLNAITFIWFFIFSNLK